MMSSLHTEILNNPKKYGRLKSAVQPSNKKQQIIMHKVKTGLNDERKTIGRIVNYKQGKK